MDDMFLSTGQAARRLRVPRHRLTYAFESGHLPEPLRVAGRRMIPESSLPEIAASLGIETPSVAASD